MKQRGMLETVSDTANTIKYFLKQLYKNTGKLSKRYKDISPKTEQTKITSKIFLYQWQRKPQNRINKLCKKNTFVYLFNGL